MTLLMKPSRQILLNVVTALACVTSSSAWAQTKPIRIIVPYAAGGPIDVTARVLAERVKDSLGTVIIENRPGAGGNIGADAVAKAAILPPAPGRFSMMTVPKLSFTRSASTRAVTSIGPPAA